MSDKNSPIDRLVQQFLEYLEVERGLSPLTVRNYSFWLGRFIGWLKHTNSQITMNGISNDSVRNFRLWLARKPGRDPHRSLSSATQGYHVIALRSFLRWCARNDIATLAAEKIDVPKQSERAIHFLTPEQVARLLSAPTGTTPKSLRDRAILEVLFSTGLRVSELVSLDRDQVDLSRREFGVVGKGGRARVVFLSVRAESALRRYLDRRQDHFSPLFLRYGGKKFSPTSSNADVRLTQRSVQRMVEQYRKKVGIATRITPHGLRHSFATDLLRGGADLREVQELLGHKNVSTTQIYTHVTNRQLKEVHERAHSGNR